VKLLSDFRIALLIPTILEEKNTCLATTATEAARTRRFKCKTNRVRIAEENRNGETPTTHSNSYLVDKWQPTWLPA